MFLESVISSNVLNTSLIPFLKITFVPAQCPYKLRLILDDRAVFYLCPAGSRDGNEGCRGWVGWLLMLVECFSTCCCSFLCDCNHNRTHTEESDHFTTIIQTSNTSGSNLKDQKLKIGKVIIHIICTWRCLVNSFFYRLLFYNGGLCG